MLEAQSLARDVTPGSADPQAPGKPPRGDSNGLVSGIKPQLLNPVDESGVDSLIRHSDYVAQELLSGIRRLIRKSPQGIQGIDRDGRYTSLPPALVKCANRIPESFTIDGELVADTFHAFDLLDFEGVDRRDRGYLTRLSLLKDVLGSLASDASSPLRILLASRDWRGKQNLMERARTQAIAGVVFKDAWAPYYPGRPVAGGTQFRYVPTHLVFCRVSATPVVGRSVGLELLDEEKGQWVGVGSVSLAPQQALPAPHTVCEVRYRYAGVGGVLHDARYVEARAEIPETEAHLTQLWYRPDLSN